MNIILQTELERISEVDDNKLARIIAGFLSVSDPNRASLYKRAYDSRKIK